MSFVTDYFEKRGKKEIKVHKSNFCHFKSILIISFSNPFDNFAKLSLFISFLINYFEKKEREKDKGAEFKSLYHFKGILVILILTTFDIFVKLSSLLSIR